MGKVGLLTPVCAVIAYCSTQVGERKYCDQFVRLSVYVSMYLSVCVREHISGTAGLIFTKFVVQIPLGHGSVLLWRCNTLCTSGCMDDVTFDRNGPWLAALRYRDRV